MISWPCTRMDPESGFCRPMMSLSCTLLPVPLRPSIAKVSPLFTVRLIPSKTIWMPKDLCKPRSTTAGPACSPPELSGTEVSARITKSEDMTTELVAEIPTPAVPPCVRIPWKQPIIPMINPKMAVLKVGARKSLKLVPAKPRWMNLVKEMGSTRVSASQPNRTPKRSSRISCISAYAAAVSSTRNVFAKKFEQLVRRICMPSCNSLIRFSTSPR